MSKPIYAASRYEELLELSRGGMGTVALARAIGVQGFERLVAIKRPLESSRNDPEFCARFVEEAKTAAQVHHANVVGIHGAGLDDRGLFLVLEYVEGETLAGLVDRSTLRRQNLPISVVARIILDALAGLSAVHEARDRDGRPLHILHRDVSPSNLLVGRDGVTRLSDFGISKHSRSGIVTERDQLPGKLVFLPPEYLRREPVGPTLDVYAMGLTMQWALTRADPFGALPDAQLLGAILAGERQDILGIRPEVPESLVDFVHRASDPKPESRYASAAAMMAALENAVGEIASARQVSEVVEGLMGAALEARRRSAASPIAAPKTAINPRAHAQRTLWWGLFTMALIMALAGAALWKRRGRSERLDPVRTTFPAPVPTAHATDEPSLAPGDAMSRRVPNSAPATDLASQAAPGHRPPLKQPSISTKNPYRRGEGPSQP